MYLKSIEIQGFKSFANKIVFEFHNGITGIVGPNGSGKSNVADAVRWVLGEQRIKQLRGASMQDVIFSGTEARKPQGFAYVAITLDNSDHQLAIEFDQVMVSRRIYRSGESEYMLNGTVCRLRDVNELFYDTGIGKEGYSIIGQGQIDKILSGKPEERRELFDEAAGIVKFKRRKAIAQKKLEDEKQNLVRVEDILSELEKQVGPLKRQSETAREYLRLKEELKVYDVNQFLLEHGAITSQMGEVGQKLAIVQGDLEQSNRQSEELKAEHGRLEEQIQVLDGRLQEQTSCLNEETVRKSGLEGQINVLHEQIRSEQLQAEHIQERIQSIEQEVGERERQMESYQKEMEGIAGQEAEATGRLSREEEALQKADEEILLLDQQIESGKGSIIDTLNEKAFLSAKQQRYETLLEQVDVRRSEVSQKLLKFKTDESIQQGHLEEEERKLSGVREHIGALSDAQARSEGQIIQMEQEIRRLNKNLSDRQQEYHTSYNKLESLKNIAERYEGYGNSIRRVMEVKDRIRGIHGVVADLVTVKKEYEIAIETALGGSIQNIVTDSEQTAKQLIEYLKKNRYGRATFLPLTSVGKRGGFSQEKALSEPGILGLAHELVEVRPEYDGLARYLLGRVVVADTIDHAIALARKFQYSLRIVTLEGELLSAGGSMTGGAFKNTSNLLGRKREMEELEERCEKALHSIDKLERDLADAEVGLKKGREGLEALKEEWQGACLEQNTVEMNISQLQERQNELRESAADLVRENRQLEQQLSDIRGSKENLAADMDGLEQRNAQTTGEIESMAARLEGMKAGRAERAQALAHIQMEAANLGQKLSFARENLRRVQAEAGRFKEELHELARGSGDSYKAVAEKQEEIGRIHRQIEELSSSMEELEQAIQDCKSQKEELSSRQKDFFGRREELSRRTADLDKELFRLGGQREKLEERLEQAANYMWNEYELTYSAAEPMRDEGLSSLPDIRKRIDSLKADIRGLGNVNVNSIEDYKEISERYTFMKTQHDDLVEAERTLAKIIEELDEGMRRQFQEKFQEIRQEFDKVFKELFGGGRGTLELMEDEDILEAGIQIISQPPGKKLQNMMQLSGGEKALTAIALLFAIQNLKPSPFCLLDEIEAALDDSNVGRFAKYLHKLTRYTQFIVITHRRGTMVEADRLYGITMQEKGVSTLVSVNLIEDGLEA